MDLAKLANRLLLLRVQLFRPTKEHEGGLPRWQRSRRQFMPFCRVLLAFWKPTDQVITHAGVGPLVASRHEFLMEANHIVATRLPSLKEIEQIRIEAAYIGAPRGLRIGSNSKPVANRAVTNAHSLGNRGLAH